MGKHDRFSWDGTGDGYFKNRVDSLQEQLENAHKEIERCKRYIDKLEKALAESASRCANVEKAFIQEAIRNVEM